MPPDHHSYCVYIMGSLSGTLYIGMTGNLHRRVFEHKFHRIEGFTDEHNVERLLYWKSFDRVEKAIDREKQLKGWRRSEKTALIESANPCWLDLSRTGIPGRKSLGATLRVADFLFRPRFWRHQPISPVVRHQQTIVFRRVFRDI